ncbi:MAG: hypothetical protein KDD45_09965 [Bdellovibrionales bacterium]|nr:hypothetical protein [Bdellovibrionales bacterium]
MNFKLVALLSIFQFSIISHAQSKMTHLPQCSGDLAVPKLTCINPNSGDDVRLYIMEFQDCSNGNITNLERSELGFLFPDSISESEEPKLTVQYSGIRTYLDERVDDLSFELPSSATLETENAIIQMTITNEKTASYEGANIVDDYYFKGSFKRLNKLGNTISTGLLACFINR